MPDPFPASSSQPSPELGNAMSALTSSWLMHEPPIIGLDPSIVIHQYHLHLTLGVMAFAPNPNPSFEHGRDLVGAGLFLRNRPGADPTAHAFTRLTIMQSDPERVHVLMVTLIYAPDGLFCGVCSFFSDQFHLFSPPSIPFDPFILGMGCRTDRIGFSIPFMVRSKKVDFSLMCTHKFRLRDNVIPHHIVALHLVIGQRLSAQPRQCGVHPVLF
jgi:hypothetical protein